MENFAITEEGIISLKLMTEKILDDHICRLGTTKETLESELIYMNDLKQRLADDNYKNLTSPDQFKADATTVLYIMNRGIAFMKSASNK
jgi:hypothetical protein